MLKGLRTFCLNQEDFSRNAKLDVVKSVYKTPELEIRTSLTNLDVALKISASIKVRGISV